MEHFKMLSRGELNDLAKALHVKIKEKGGAKSTEPEVQELVRKLRSVNSIIADNVIKEAEEEATRRYLAEKLKGINARTYRPPSGKPASDADRQIPKELIHRTYVPGELEIGNKPVSIDEIFPDNNTRTATPIRKKRSKGSK